MSIFFKIFLFGIVIFGCGIYCKGQSFEDYHVMGGISPGYRQFSMSDFNSYYSWEGFYKQPYLGTPVASAWLEAKPFKNNRITISLGYDWIPNAKRNSEIEFVNTAFQSQTQSHDSTVDKFNETVQLHVLTLFIGYDLPFKKIALNLSAGATYTSFQTNVAQLDTNYLIDNTNKKVYKNPIPDSSPINSRGNGFGFSLKISARYLISSRLYASASLLANFAQIPLYENNQKILLNQSGIYIGSYYINNSTYLNADLSGIQANIGLQYVIF